MSKQYRYTLRFNLGTGANYMKWRLLDTQTGKAEYLDPDTTQITMHTCKLVNQKGTANKIKAGANKAVCAWVAFNHYTTQVKVTLNPTRKALQYNPRITPNWVDTQGNNIDGATFATLMTNKNKVYVLHKGQHDDTRKES